MYSIIYPFFLILFLSGCNSRQKVQNSADENLKTTHQSDTSYKIINPEGVTILERINPPEGYTRIELNDTSFGRYLRNLPLKKHGSDVHLFDGSKRHRQDVHVAVIDMDVGDRDLQQCADAVMRLRAEYLYHHQQPEKIQFHFTNGFLADFNTWSRGNKISVNGNQVKWVNNPQCDSSYESFRKYLTTVFAYAGTLSLERETIPVKIEDAMPGDFFIHGGSPGHAIIIIDICENKTSGEKMAILAQSYMPAQEIHILKNPQNVDDNPWYNLEFDSILVTPEWTFSKSELHRF